MSPESGSSNLSLEDTWEKIDDNWTYDFMLKFDNDLNITSSINVSSDDYVYDYDAAVAMPPLAELVPVTLFYGLTFIIGFIGNLLVVISVAKFKRMQNVTNVFLLSLATADLLLIIICVPIKCAAFLSYTWEFGAFLCKAVHYIQNVSIICSVLNLTGISMERYYAILHPMKAKYTCTVNLARKSVLVIWVISLILATPIIFGRKHILVGELRKGYWCLKQLSKPLYSQLYEIYMFSLIFVLPLLIMMFTYASICRELWMAKNNMDTLRANKKTFPVNESRDSFDIQTRHQSGRKKAHRSDGDATRKQVIKMLAAVVILFAICWGPIMLNNLLVALDVLELLHRGSLKPIRQTLSLMSYANSCINPIVYGFMSKNFRATFKHTACLCCLRKNSAWATRENARSSYLQNRSTSLTFTRGTSLQSGYDKNSAGVRRCQYATTKHHSSKVSEVNL